MLPIIPILTPIIDKLLSFIPNAAEREKAKLQAELALKEQESKMIELLTQVDIKQAEINAAEANSTDRFKSWYRPFIGWVCGAAFAWVYVAQPVLSFIFIAVGHPLTLPRIEFGDMSTVLFGMLGLSGLRTYEKKSGVA